MPQTELYFKIQNILTFIGLGVAVAALIFYLVIFIIIHRNNKR